MFYAEITRGRSEDVDDSPDGALPEDSDARDGDYDGDADDTCLTVSEVLARTRGRNSNTEPSASERRLEDGGFTANEPAEQLGRGRRVKKPTKRFTDAEWCGH